MDLVRILDTKLRYPITHNEWDFLMNIINKAYAYKKWSMQIFFLLKYKVYIRSWCRRRKNICKISRLNLKKVFWNLCQYKIILWWWQMIYFIITWFSRFPPEWSINFFVIRSRIYTYALPIIRLIWFIFPRLNYTMVFNIPCRWTSF